ncbi:MAG TPA: PSD1 and planctomycete cytochrome C domain-containing protein [Candidatus Limnocylindria bacterium]|nr:PSD1 and planctomycete cytochrome C domain-containing protein [Candidatus Limnocylindria bacterium]
MLVGVRAATPVAGKIQFNRDVRPILSDHCFTCHGQDEKSRKGGLRLDDLTSARTGGKSGKAAIVAGKPDTSELMARIAAHDPDEVMPPPTAKNPVTPAEIKILRQWIASGAEYEKHWAFIAPQRPPPPKYPSGASPTRKVKSPIDAFVAQKLTHEHVTFSVEATPETLIRRVSLDLVGIPPTLTEVDAFVTDYTKRGEAAYLALVDRLLASERYGERWARWWLDAARYSDSDGYEKDLVRDQWPWRDWVINAFNRDLSYDRFIIEQVGGDLLPNATQDQRIATGFLRNGMVNEEGAIINEQFRIEGLIDRLDCLGKSVLGLTVQCAQCHSHKFDPLTHEEYYRLFAYLNNDYEAKSWIYNASQLKTIADIRQETALEEEKIKQALPDWSSRMARWEEKQRNTEIGWTTLEPQEPEWGGGLAHPDKLPDNSVITLGFRPSNGELTLRAETRQTNVTALRLEALTHGDLPFGGPGRSVKGSFALSELMVESRSLHSTNAWATLTLTNATADFAEVERPLEAPFRAPKDEKRTVGPAAFLFDGKEETAWSADRGPGRRNAESQIVAQFTGTNRPTYIEGTEFRFTLKYRHSGSDGHGRENNFLGRFRLAITDSKDAYADTLPPLVRTVLHKAPEARTAAEKQALFSTWRGAAPECEEYNKRIEAAWRKYPEGGTILNLVQREPEWMRTAHLLERGNWQKPGPVVQTGTPAFLHSLPADAPPNRLTLARWLVDRKSPTTARVAVNRVWQALFGLGLVETAEDFGVRAPLPTHPELLDWLAVEFMDPVTLTATETAAQPWSIKHLLRTIVTSAIYRQSSRTNPDLQERDPRNLWLARGPRFRAEAELVRDIALSASGLRHDQIGGPSFYPPIPESLFALNYLRIDWPVASAPDRYRRSLYMFRRRGMPDPVLANFDSPNGDFACVRRLRSNTPLAALTSLNEPIFIEAAQALARRVLQEGGATDRDRASYAFRLCTARSPKPLEVQEILTLLASSKQRAGEGWINPQQIAALDENQLQAIPGHATPTELAAWAVVSRVLLNLDETLTKN